MMSHNKWYMVPIMPCLIIIHHWYSVLPEHTFNLLTCLTAAISGLLFFSLFEYVLHRFVFHSESILPDSRLARYLHFNTHGVHHMLPNDPYSLPYSATA